jgi:hypothetical protein
VRRGELIADHRALESMVAQLRTTAAADLLEQFWGLLTSLPREELDRVGAEIGRRV